MRLGRAQKKRVTNPLGIWQPEYRKDYSLYQNQADARKTVPSFRAKHRRKQWGLLSVVISVPSFLATGVIFGILLLTQYIRSHPTIAGNAASGRSEDLNKLIQGLTQFSTQPVNLVLSGAVMYLTWLAFMAFATYVRGLKSWRKDFWLRWRLRDVPLGFLIGAGLFAASNLLSWIAQLLHIDLSGTDNGSFLFQSSGPALYLVAFGLGGIVGPIMEELYFRGFIMQGLIRYFRKGLRTTPNTAMGITIQKNNPRLYRRYTRFKHWLYHHKYSIAVILTAIVFGAVHVGEVQGIGNQLFVGLVTGSIGAVLGLVAIKTRRLGMNMMTHMTYNTLGIALAFLIPS